MTKNEIDKLYAAATASVQTAEPSFIRASTADLRMFIRCRKEGKEMPAAGSDEFWELFDQVNTEGTEMDSCPRSLMEKYLDREPTARQMPSEIANDSGVQELESLIADRQK